MRIDCHFHPNLRLSSAKAVKTKALKIFEKFSEHKIDAVIVTEHVFKKPYQAFQKLKKHQPSSSKTLLIPGVEAVSKEGIDVIIFSACEYIYTQKDLMKTWGLPIKDMIKKVATDPNLNMIIPHPFLKSQQGIVKNLGLAELKKLVSDIDLIEKHNACFNSLIKFIEQHPLKKIFKNQLDSLKQVQNADLRNLKSVVFSGGSDAHHPWNIGSHLKLFTKTAKSNQEAINKLKSNIEREMVYIKSQMPVIPDLIANGVTALSELAMLYLLKPTIDFKPIYNEQLQNIHQARRSFGQAES